ncbi:MAG: hypothetical protein KDD42_09725, partial [Bdellovibrionales bacterium]|nr:hypothetical protein [Bdellovibrionales bacterium]
MSYLTGTVKAFAFLSLFLLLPNPLYADGTEVLGAPSISLQSGSSILAAGTGMVHQPGEINLALPTTAEVKQVLLYWEGNFSTAPGDNTIEIRRAGGSFSEVHGILIGGPYPELDVAAYRADITDLNLVQPGENSLELQGMDFGDINNGAGVFVIIDDGSGIGALELRDGEDNAYIHAPLPELKVTTPLSFSFGSAPVDRVADLRFFFGEVQGEHSGGGQRPTSIEVTIGDNLKIYSDLLGSHDGEEWDTLVLSEVIPAGVTTLKVQAFSRDDNDSGRTPASMQWNLLSFFLPNKNPECEAGGPYLIGCHGSITELSIDDFVCVDPEGMPLNYQWDTDCEGATMINSSTLHPTLILTKPGSGLAQSCNISVTVSDSINSSTYSSVVTAEACPLDCLGMANGIAQLDKCGVCDGNNECLDCADVPFGQNIFDQQNPAVCCLPNQIDQCGVCYGDNSSCVACTDVMVSSELEFHKLGFNHQYSHLKRLFRKAEVGACKDDAGIKAQIRKMQRNARKLSLQDASLSDSIPLVVESCDL